MQLLVGEQPSADPQQPYCSLQAQSRQVSNPSQACESKFDRSAFPAAMQALQQGFSRGLLVGEQPGADLQQP